MSNEIPLEDYKRAYREMKIEEEKRGFLIHLVVYALINAGLITLNLLVVPKVIWFFWPLLGWGIGITVHYLNAVRWIERELKKKEAIAESRAKELGR
ncbi:MAG: 2TM domain-containing protein [Dehalococcoidales bacterium]|nr:2TM domain-containing protein [Dehalococcoidales bacterium]